MEITKITQQKKNKGRYNLYLDNDFWLGIDESILVKFAIFKGQTIDESLKSEIENYEHRNKYYDKAIQYLSRSMKSKKQVQQYLIRQMDKDVETQNMEEIITWVIDRLTLQGYLDDLEFSKSFVRHQAHIQHISPVKIRQQLLQKGIEDQTIQLALDEYDYQQLLKNIENTTKKYIKSHRNISRKLLKDKIRQHLQYKGFKLDHILKVDIDNLLPEDSNREAKILENDMEKIYTKFEKKYAGYNLMRRVIQNGMRKGHDYEAIQSWLYQKEQNSGGQ